MDGLLHPDGLEVGHAPNPLAPLRLPEAEVVALLATDTGRHPLALQQGQGELAQRCVRLGRVDPGHVMDGEPDALRGGAHSPLPGQAVQGSIHIRRGTEPIRFTPPKNAFCRARGLHEGQDFFFHTGHCITAGIKQGFTQLYIGHCAACDGHRPRLPMASGTAGHSVLREGLGLIRPNPCGYPWYGPLRQPPKLPMANAHR